MRLPLALVFAIGLGLPGAALAEPTDNERNQARALANEGADLYDAGKYEDAIAKFDLAESHVHAPPHLLYLARANDKLGRLIEARAIYERIMADEISERSPPAFREAQDKAREELIAIAVRIPVIAISIAAPPGPVRVSLDGREIEASSWSAVSVNPGAHSIDAEGTGASGSRKFQVGEAEHVTVSLELRASYAPAGIAFGVAGSAFVLGTVTGIVALVRASGIESRCPDQECRPTERPAADTVKVLGTVSTIGFLVAAAGAGVGTWLLLKRPRTARSVSARAGLGSASLEVKF